MEVIRKNRLLAFWAIAAGLAAVLIWHLPWRFQVNDDEVMMWLVSGAYTGRPAPYAVFLHPLMSWCISGLYGLAPQLPWYPWLWFLGMFSSFVLLASLVQDKFGTALQGHVWTLFLFAFYIHFLFFLQFSIVSGFAIFAGLLARYGTVGKGGQQKTFFRPTDLFLVIGFLVRPEVLLLFLMGVFVLNLLFFREKWFFGLSFVPFLVAVVGYSISFVWISQSGLSEFERVNRLRSQVFDHPVLQLQKEEIKQSHPDLYHFSNGLIDFQNDPQLVGQLRHWKQELDAARWEDFGAGAVAKSFGTYVEHEHFLIGLMVLFSLFSLFFAGVKALRVLLALVLGMLALSPFFLLKVQIYGLVFLVLMLSVFCFLPHSPGQRPVSWLFASLVVLAVVFHFRSFFLSSANWVPAEGLDQRLGRLQADGYEDIFVIAPANVYSELLFHNPGRFKVMGWPTLLEQYQGKLPSDSRAYLVDSATYRGNEAYFEGDEMAGFESGLYLLLSRP
ncbi:hypothetical protein J0A68_18380 [Algoriphagus sp. H41]|uniref:Glycosyltransferase RgtA/B/C/D-like domain-containing protein n=1 Tax=Algoriphagus oliviformis TaxID=2811231 RepID=A0ABS3C733_9BACT|nr:hypothetical protein [Algoriphagus oliviformis]MBN7812930.1 hypothetical protein [Algoriphagus oliviformis]